MRKFSVFPKLVLIACLVYAFTYGPDLLFAASYDAGRVTASEEYRVGPENVLQIDVYYGRGEKLAQKVKVSSRGLITFPLLGEVEVAGLTVSQTEKKLTELLGADYFVNPQVSVFVEEYSTVSILGEVTKPGAYPIQGGMTVVQLISKAEGFTKMALQEKVKVMRPLSDGTKQEITVRVKDVMANKEGDVPLKAGDVVLVDKEYNTVSVLGQVDKPGTYPIEGSMTIVQLIATAGGFTRIADPNKTKIIRALPDGSKEEIQAKVKDITNNRESDIPLQAGDVVVVAESFF